jgi:hypothetical protein
VKKVKQPAKQQTPEGDVPDFEVPSGENDMKKRRLPEKAAFVIGFHKFSEDSSLFDFPGGVEPVICMIFDHAAFPSLLFKYAETREQFHAEMHDNDATFPQSGKDFDKQLELRQVMGSEPPLAGMIAYRRATYMKQSAVITYMDYLDTFLFWRQQGNFGGTYPAVEIHITNATEFTFDTHDKVYECTVKWKNESPSPFDVFSVPSASWRKVFPSISITKLSAETVSIRFEGDTWSFKAQFNQCGIHGRFENSDGQVVPSTATQEEKRNVDYVRLIKSINVQGPKECGFLENLFGNIVYKTTMVRVTWIGTCAAEEPVHAFKTKLELLPNVCLRTESTVTNE